jgi:hypothetical protein
MRQVIRDIATCTGTVPDRSGKLGVDLPRSEAFFAACEAFDAWIQKAEAGAANILPLGSATSAAAAAVQAIRSKVNDYFGRCRLAAYDPRALAHLNRREEGYLIVAAQDLTITAAEISGFPLAQVAPGRPLPLVGGTNPAHAVALAVLRERAVSRSSASGTSARANRLARAAAEARAVRGMALEQDRGLCGGAWTRARAPDPWQRREGSRHQPHRPGPGFRDRGRGDRGRAPAAALQA